MSTVGENNSHSITLHFIQITHVEEAHVSREGKVGSMGQRLVVEVGPHVVCHRHDVGAHVLEVAVEGGGLLKELELDHVSVVAARAGTLS